MSDTINDNQKATTVLIDWRVNVSRDSEIVDIKPMGRDMSRTRLMPVFLMNGELSIVVPAVSDEAAKRKAKIIAQHIISSGVWGLEVWNFPEFLGSIEKLM